MISNQSLYAVAAAPGSRALFEMYTVFEMHPAFTTAIPAAAAARKRRAAFGTVVASVRGFH